MKVITDENILQTCSLMDEHPIFALDRLIQVKLANRLSGKKLLLVLDGLLDVNQGELELLLNVLRISATEGSQLTSMPSGIGNLTNLQTLKDFIVSTKGALLSEIKNITGIQGSICIKKLENIVREEETLETVLKNKKFLHRLELQWSDMQDEGVQMECRNCDILPPLSHLPMLKSLEIAEMLMVQSIDSIFCGNGVRFPSLETLKLKDMPKLKRWDSLRENDMPRLCTLVIDTCPQLTHLSSIHHLASLNELQLIRCYGLSMLPEEGLPSGLHSLIIIDCPLLSGCGMGGEYWHMIENIPHREILI
ncbi:hypothetical protein Sjap_012893 [Stephania japonica]|uniref:R13L1/DRL21-like LRR repeat region domain-containing protein n=1 Tax=Stephania japonica TaxID=461633 RepID=A0AAP0IWY7_9MAGN